MYPYRAPLEVSFLCTAWKDAQKEDTALGKGYYFARMSSRAPCAAAALLGERHDRHIGQCLDEPGWLLDTTYLAGLLSRHSPPEDLLSESVLSNNSRKATTEFDLKCWT